MQVTFKAPQVLGNKSYKAGLQIVPDHLANNVAFKKLVKAGMIVVHPRDLNAQDVQAAKDAQNKLKAEKARALTKQMEQEKK